MAITMQFDRPFGGMIYARDMFEADECLFWDGREHEAQRVAHFSVPMFQCGTTSSRNPTSRQHAFEAVLVVQRGWKLFLF